MFLMGLEDAGLLKALLPFPATGGVVYSGFLAIGLDGESADYSFWPVTSIPQWRVPSLTVRIFTPNHGRLRGDLDVCTPVSSFAESHRYVPRGNDTPANLRKTRRSFTSWIALRKPQARLQMGFHRRFSRRSLRSAVQTLSLIHESGTRYQPDPTGLAPVVNETVG